NLGFTSKIVRSVFTGHYRIRVITTGIIVSLLVIVIAPNILNPLYMKFSRFPGSKLASYEYEAALWLRDNTEETEVILSDYWTMMLLNPLSNKIWLTDRQFRYEPLDLEYKHLLEELRNGVFKAPNPQAAYRKIITLVDEMRFGIDWTEQYYCNYVGIDPKNISFIIVLSSRTVKWLETEKNNVMEPQYSTVNNNYLAIFNNAKYFTPLFKISRQIYIFKVKI
ncbi:MAG: hypothetical protein ACTSPL_08605, partial [Candidatus Odinarchaeia archaeon]